MHTRTYTRPLSYNYQPLHARTQTHTRLQVSLPSSQQSQTNQRKTIGQHMLTGTCYHDNDNKMKERNSMADLSACRSLNFIFFFFFFLHFLDQLLILKNSPTQATNTGPVIQTCLAAFLTCVLHNANSTTFSEQLNSMNKHQNTCRCISPNKNPLPSIRDRRCYTRNIIYDTSAQILN